MMNNLPRALKDLLPGTSSYEKRALLIKELQQQIARDFKQEHAPEPHQMGLYLEKALKAYEKNREELRNLLYRIDIEEKGDNYNNLMHYSIEDLALLILKREAQKVIFRLQYAGRL